MRTEDLVAQLVTQLPHTGSRHPLPRFAAALVACGIVSAAILAVAMGAPLRQIGDVGKAAMAMKLGFTLSLALTSGLALFVSGKPGHATRGALFAAILPLMFVGVLAATELIASNPHWPGATWATCISAISLLTLPCLSGILLAMRRLAPVRLKLSGALAAACASSIAASAYALWCPETEALFLLSWYAGPIVLTSIVGAALGPRFLRW